MAVVTGKSDLFGADADPARAKGRPVVTAFSVANAASDSNGSKYLLCRLPSYAVLDALTTIKADTWGFATVNIGTGSNTTALFTAAKNAAHVPITRNGTAHGLPLWQMLGLAADPGGEIELYAHASADAAAAGTMKGEIHWRDRK